MSETFSTEHDSFHLGSRTWPPSLCTPWTSLRLCRELEQKAVKVTIAPAETISHFYRSSAQQSSQARRWVRSQGCSYQPHLSEAASRDTPITAPRAREGRLSPSAGGRRGPVTTLSWGKAGEGHSRSQLWIAASERARKEQGSKLFECFQLPSPLPQGEECGEGGEGGISAESSSTI